MRVDLTTEWGPETGVGPPKDRNAGGCCRHVEATSEIRERPYASSGGSPVHERGGGVLDDVTR
jgi:hypothetical protein